MARLPIHIGDPVRRLKRICRDLEAAGFADSLAAAAEWEKISREEAEQLLTIGAPYLIIDVDRRAVPDRVDACDTDALGGLDLHGWRHEDALAELSERERLVIELRFGIGSNEPQTLDEVGQVLGITRERVRQIQAEAMERLSGAWNSWEKGPGT